MTCPYVNINGKLVQLDVARTPIDNSAFRYGYGIFETILFKTGDFPLLQLHFKRLVNGLAQLGISTPKSLANNANFEHELRRTIEKNKQNNLCRVRLQVYGAGGGVFDPATTQGNFIIECFELEPAAIEFNENGLVVGIAHNYPKGLDRFSNLKSCNAINYVMAAQWAKQNKLNDALMLNTTGNIIESTIANIFWVRDKNIFTPPLSEGCIAGVMRKHILNTVPEIQEQSLSIQALIEADEVFLTNALRGIKWVRSIDNTHYSSSITRQLRHLCDI